MKRQNLWVFWSILGLLAAALLPLQSVAAQTPKPEPLFKDAPTPEVQAAAQDPLAERVRYVSLDMGVLQPVLTALRSGQSADLALNLYDDTLLTAHLTQLETTPSGGSVLSGTLLGQADSEVTLALQDTLLVGNVRAAGQRYMLRAVGNGLQTIAQRRLTVSPPDAEAPVPPNPPQLSTQDSYGDDDGSYIDVLVVYTPAALSQQGSTSAMQALIGSVISETNTGYQSSQISQRARLVHSEMIDYSETNFDWNTTLNRLTYTGDGFLDSVQTLRSTYAADLVVLLVSSSANGVAGIGWMMGPDWINHAFEAYGFSVVSAYWALNNYTLAHEMGHNMGANHDRAIAAGQGAYDYSYGYCLPGTDGERYHTIMAYDSYDCPIRINHWSNPNVNHPNDLNQSVATGVTGSEDNAQTLNNTNPIVTQFRDGPPSLFTPGNVSASDITRSQATLSWTDASAGIVSFRLERAVYQSGIWGAYQRNSQPDSGHNQLDG